MKINFLFILTNFALVFWTHWTHVKCQDINYEEYEKESSIDFKIDLSRWSLECYFQYARATDIMHVILAVMSGGDLKMDVHISDPNGLPIHRSSDTVYVWYDSKLLNYTGDYKICVQNKNAYVKRLYMNVVVNTRQGYDEKTQKHKALNDTHTYMDERIAKIMHNLYITRRLQIRQRIDYAGDSYLVEGNNSFVMYYSIVQCSVIIISGLVQTYFIKKLFQEPKMRKFPSF